MKATTLQLKKKLNALADRHGYKFSAKNPYYANETRYKALLEELENIIEDGRENPTLRFEVTPKQEASIRTWISTQHEKFVLGM